MLVAFPGGLGQLTSGLLVQTGIRSPDVLCDIRKNFLIPIRAHLDVWNKGEHLTILVHSTTANMAWEQWTSATQRTQACKCVS